jgi:hypothetical protein
MKTIITYLFVILSFISFSQTHNFNEDTIQKYFIELLDSMRNDLYPGIPKLEVNVNVSRACVHHNQYMSDMQNHDLSVLITHDEKMVIDDNKYKGNDTLMDYYFDRASHYDTDTTFSCGAEVITGDLLWLKNAETGEVVNFINNYDTNRRIAKRLLRNFKTSPPHYKIISGFKYNVIAIDVSILDGIVYITMITGSKKEVVNGQLVFYHNVK